MALRLLDNTAYGWKRQLVATEYFASDHRQQDGQMMASRRDTRIARSNLTLNI